MMIFTPVYEGVKSHFHIRLSEWLMVLPAFGMWGVLNIDPDMFAKSPSFLSMANWYDERTWGLIVGVCAIIRLAALVVNGTFKKFRFSPHLRLFASLVGLAFWWGLTQCFIDAYWFHGGAPSAIVAYGTFCIAELANCTRSGRDTGIEIGQLLIAWRKRRTGVKNVRGH